MKIGKTITMQVLSPEWGIALSGCEGMDTVADFEPM